MSLFRRGNTLLWLGLFFCTTRALDQAQAVAVELPILNRLYMTSQHGKSLLIFDGNPTDFLSVSIFFGITSDLWFDCIINNNLRANLTCSNFMREYDIDHFSRVLSDVCVTVFATIIQIFSVNIIMLTARGITYVSCYFGTVLVSSCV